MDKLTKQIGMVVTITMMVVLGGVLYGITALSPRMTLGGSSTTATCSVSGTGAIYVRVVLDADHSPVQGATLNGVETYSCGGIPQVWSITAFQQQTGGWYSPSMPSGAATAGQFTVNVQYSGRSYSNIVSIEPLQVTCFTLSLPSGNYTAGMYSANNALSQCLSH